MMMLLLTVTNIRAPLRDTFVFRSAGGMRRGYMGHLTRIANTVVHNLEKGPVHTQISRLIAGVCMIVIL